MVEVNMNMVEVNMEEVNMAVGGEHGVYENRDRVQWERGKGSKTT